MKYSDCGVVLVEMVSHPRRKEAEVPIILKEARAVHSRSYLWSEICALRFTGHIYFRSSKRHPGPSGPFCHLMDFFTLPCHIARRCLEELKISSSTMFSDLGRSTPWAPCNPNKPFKSGPKVNRPNLGKKAPPTPPTPRLFLENSTSQIHPKLLRFKEHPEGKLSVGCFGLDDLQELGISVATCCHATLMGVVELNACRARRVYQLSPESEGGCLTVFPTPGAQEIVRKRPRHDVSFTQRSNESMIGYRYLTLCSTPRLPPGPTNPKAFKDESR